MGPRISKEERKRIKESKEFTKKNWHKSIFYGMSRQEIIDFMRGRIKETKSESQKSV